jgi:hypothetical protein
MRPEFFEELVVVSGVHWRAKALPVFHAEKNQSFRRRAISTAFPR